MLFTVSAPSVPAATSLTLSVVASATRVAGGIVARIALYLLVCWCSAHYLPEVCAEETSELLKKLNGQQADLVCSPPAGITVGFAFPTTSCLSTEPFPLVVHLTDTAMVSVSTVGVVWLSLRLRVVRNAVAA